MKVHVWGTDFRRSDSEFRSKIYIPQEDRKVRLEKLIQLGFPDLVYIATCNRVEFYTAAEDYFQDTRELYIQLLAEFGLTYEDFYKGYHLEGKSAIRHLLRVASSLESMVLGESEILGQIKQSYAWTKEAELPVTPGLEKVFQFTFQTAKKVRAESGLGEKSVSIGSLAFEVVQEWIEKQADKTLVLVGRSPILVTLATDIRKQYPSQPLLWVNRHLDKLEDIAKPLGIPTLSLHDFYASKSPVHGMVSATSSPEILFDEGFWEMRLSKDPALIIDLAQPHDVSLDTQAHPQVQWLTLDHLGEKAKANAGQRKGASDLGHKILEQEFKRFCLEQKEAPILKRYSLLEPELFSEMAEIISELPLPLSEQQKQILDEWARKLVKKNFHSTREHLRSVLRDASEPSEIPAL